MVIVIEDPILNLFNNWKKLEAFDFLFLLITKNKPLKIGSNVKSIK